MQVDLAVGPDYRKLALHRMFPPTEYQSLESRLAEQERECQKERHCQQVLSVAREVDAYVDNTLHQASQTRRKLHDLARGCHRLSQSFEEAKDRVARSASRRLAELHEQERVASVREVRTMSNLRVTHLQAVRRSKRPPKAPRQIYTKNGLLAAPNAAQESIVPKSADRTIFITNVKARECSYESN